MDPDPSSRRKMKFTPKAPRRTNAKLVIAPPVKEADGDHDDIQLLRRLTRQTRRGPEVEKKPAEEVLFSHGVTLAPTDDQSERANGSRQKEIKDEQMRANSSRQKEIKDEQMQSRTIVSSAGTGVDEESGSSTITVSPEKKKKEYKEPWDYSNSYYPITLPLRRPYSGNPHILDKEEFEEAPNHNEDDDMPPAIELGLVDQDDKPQLLFFKFPSKLPFGRPAMRGTDSQSKEPEKSLINPKGKGIAGLPPSVSITKAKEIGGRKTCSLEELPKGYLGKMLVYKSGAVKLKFGDVLFDVSAGIECNCPQSAMAIDTTTGDCCELGEVTKKAIVTPNLDHLDTSND